MKKIVFVGLLLVSAFRALSQEMDYSHLYNPKAELSLDHQLVQEGDKLIVLFAMKIQNQNYQLYDYTFELYNLENYSSEFTAPLVKDSYDSIYLESNASTHYFKFVLNDLPPLPLLVLEIKNKKTGFGLSFDLPLYDKQNLFLNNGSAHKFVNNWTAPTQISFNSDNIYCYYYNQSFPLGLPPMVTKDDFKNKELKVDSSFSSSGTAKLKGQGLYLFMTDTAGTEAVSLRVVYEYFPKMTTIDQLVEPLRYITSRDEQVVLEGIEGDKRKFDKFWLNLTGSASRAKSIIKVYYSRVEEANAMFTTYKEGWRTDMGMIYSVMGPPDEVIKSFNEETWVYLANRNLPKRKYSFIRAASVFSKSHFVLIREKKHAESWFETIDLLRKGIFR
ncbi:GWxTD domain-containing protein [Fulvivirga lutimaris]|uniref:GWxTD domain-containing protein n=1 Tax=Fulvivirga lutimaris TaxID=1819566 RepID=UPI0012BC66F6|nr:GWxTD domain-containing protein [Fulvivirga lutimaris]MTI40983.1 GWxTD domain-containing protein [Fulvivirga lutimaris]